MTPDDELSELRRWLDRVRSITQTVVTAQPLTGVLNLIAESASSLMGYEFCGVLVPNSSRRVLTIEGASGLSADYVSQVNADRPVRLDQDPSVEAPSSTAFRTGAPVAIADTDAEPQFAPWGGVAREQGYRAMISVPLLDSDHVAIGTLNCYRKNVHVFTPHEVSLLTLLADHASIALTTASLRSAEARQMDELVVLNRELHQQRDLLQKSEDIHRRLTEIALRGGGVEGIAAALSILISRPIVIEDVHGAIIGRSTTAATFPDDRASAHPVDLDRPGNFGYHSVRLAESEVARIWIAPGPSKLTSIDDRAIEHAALVTSLEILRTRTADEVRWRLHGEVVNDLLSGEPSATGTIVERAERLGHDLTRKHSMVVVSLSGIESADVDSGLRQSLRSIHRWAESLHPLPLAAIHHDRIVVLVPEVESDVPQTAETIRSLARSSRTASTATATAAATATAVTVGPCLSVQSYVRAYRTAAGALDTMRLTSRTDVSVSLEDLGLVGLLLQLDDTEQLLRFGDRTLGPVRAHDNTRGTELITTLRAYFANGMLTGATARTLHVHANTVAQRLRRIQTLTDLDLARPDQAMEVAVALTVSDIGTAAVDPG